MIRTGASGKSRRRSNQRSHYLLAVLVSAGLAVTLLPQQAARARALQCPNANVVVYSRNIADAQAACAGAAAAIRFLAEQGLKTGGQIEVHVVDQLPYAEPSASGVYIAIERRAYVLAFSQLERRQTLFDLPIDRLLYQSVATHEVAHIIADANFTIPRPRIEAQEYIVYVAMLATMPRSYREQVLDKFPEYRFEPETAFNTSTYLMDPLYFGVRAYRHFLKPGNGKAFFRRILAGEALSTGDGP